MNLKMTMLNNVAQTQKYKSCIFSLMCGLQLLMCVLVKHIRVCDMLLN